MQYNQYNPNYHFGMICGKSTFGRKNSNTPADVENFNLKIMTHKLTNDQIAQVNLILINALELFKMTLLVQSF